jgi:hypothetical protein
MRRAVLLLLLLAGCDTDAIRWGDPVELGVHGGDAIALDTSGHVQSAAEPVDTASVPPMSGWCAPSMRTASGTKTRYAVWWRIRPDSSAVLSSAKSLDSGRTWQPAAAVDTQDVSTRGCDRPAPSVATVGDDLQIAYSMKAPEGTGVFLAHFMGSMLHEPVAIIYGDRLVETAIAAQGDRVAVAYEDPNGPRERVAVALSSSQGHIFDVRTTASRDVDLATAPAVALAGHEVAVAWSTRRASDSTATRVVRVGRIP